MDEPLQSIGERPRVLHFVTGGFSGATQVAIDLVRAHQASGHFEPLLALRRKRQADPARIDALRAQGIAVNVVAGWSHLATIWQLVALCRRFKPDILVAHGFSEHLWGRYAGLIAGVPRLVHVEHNSRERYTRWRVAQMRWLAKRSHAIVGCSEGVRQSLLTLGAPAAKTITIANGIRTAAFKDALRHPWVERTPGIVMAARFARQKDHDTLLRAVALLRDRGLVLPVLLAGRGKASAESAARRLCTALGLDDQVRFLGHCPDVPALLMEHRICVLSSHYEGMPLSLIEGMAAGCVAVASAVPGIQELIDHGRNGLLAAHADPGALADVLQRVLTEPDLAQGLARVGREDALALYSLERMIDRYESLFSELLRL